MTDERTDPMEALEDLLGHRFEDREVLRMALRHGSSLAALGAGTYQRLEFLGDAVLGNAMALLLYVRYPEHDQGMLTRMRAHLTRSVALAEKSTLLGLEGYIELGASEEAGRGRERVNLLEDVFESVVAALMLDGGWQVALDFVENVFDADLEALDERTLIMADPKTALQEAAQSRGLPLPVYRQVASRGPDHHRKWVYEVVWDGDAVSRGEGRTKRDAQQQAARRALVRLGLVADGPLEGSRR
jgi:ribonuclease-3